MKNKSLLIQDILKYIDEVKQTGAEDTLSDIILEYCWKKGIDELEVGDAISDDVKFKQLIEWDCNKNNIFQVEQVAQTLDEW